MSEICAHHSYEFIVDERDGTGREADVPPGNSTNAKVKQLFKIDLTMQPTSAALTTGL